MTADPVEQWRASVEEDQDAASRSRSLLLIADTGWCSRNADAESTFWHYDRWHPKRVLRQVEAKRRIIEMYENAMAAHEHQDETAVELLGEAIRLLADADRYPFWPEDDAAELGDRSEAAT